MSGFKPVSKAALRRQLDDEDGRISDLKAVAIPLETRADFAREIARLWQESQSRFLAIGRYLLQAKERLPHGDYEAMVHKDLPFGTHVAYQLRTVAEAIDGGRIAEAEVPPSYSVIYRLAKLTDPELSAARNHGLIRPTVTRREIEDFARSRRPPSTEHRTILEKRRARILAQQARLQEELRRIEAELGGGIIEGVATEVPD